MVEQIFQIQFAYNTSNNLLSCNLLSCRSYNSADGHYIFVIIIIYVNIYRKKYDFNPSLTSSFYL